MLIFLSCVSVGTKGSLNNKCLLEQNRKQIQPESQQYNKFRAKLVKHKNRQEKTGLVALSLL